MKKAVIYARYSSDSQSEQSIEGQLHVCEEYAKSHDIIILNTYIDRTMTGTNDNRPDFQRMLKDSSRREWDYVLVYKLDRFSRNKYETAMHKKTLKDNGVKVISAMEYIPDSPEAIILESMLEGMAEYYSAELSQKVKRGMRETRLKGLYQGGGVPYGYKVENRRIVINESTAEIIRYIYEQYSIGVCVREIIASLTNRGILYKGKPFASHTVYGILANEKYSGIYKHEDEVIDNMYPALIPQDIYNKVRAIVEKNKYGKHSVKADYLLRQKIKCGYCGEPINGESGTTKRGEKIYYYKCNGRKMHRTNCTKSVIRKDVLEKLVIDTIICELSKPEIKDKIVNELIKRHESQLSSNIELSLLTKQQKQVETSLHNLVTAIEQGIISTTTNKRLQELEQQQAELERQILIEKSKTVVKLSKQDILSYYEQALRLEPKLLINFLIREIVLYDDKIEIYFNSPIPTSPDENSGFSFYSKTTTIIQNWLCRDKPYTQKLRVVLIV